MSKDEHRCGEEVADRLWQEGGGGADKESGGAPRQDFLSDQW
jgi:hypothetical protein